MDELDKTIPPQRRSAVPVDNDATIPGYRERKAAGSISVGDVIMNRYRVLSELGRGGMGVVYKCFDETAGIEVALKALPPELSHSAPEMEDIKENFQLVSSLVHQNIANSKTLEYDSATGNYYLIMECVEGEDLRRWIKRKRKEGPLTLEMVLPLLRQVASALDYAHGKKIIHRDIKPGNIMVDTQGQVKILDFGLAAQIHSSMTHVSMAYTGTSGTGPYMAPEQWRGKPQGAAADQYALAVMTYEMLSGQPPFSADDRDALYQAVMHETADAVPGVSKQANAALQRGLSKEPSERFSNCGDFVKALGGEKVTGSRNNAKSRKPLLVWILAFVLLLGGGAVGFWQYQDRENTKNVADEKTNPEADAAGTAKKAEEEKKTNAELKEATYKLFSAVERQKGLIESAHYDRGQTFGKQLDILIERYTASGRALDNKEIVLANSMLKEAEAAANWLIENGPLRVEVQELQKEAGSKKSDADKYDGSKLSYAEYSAAQTAEKKAESEYEKGNFPSASSLLKTAIEKYGKAEKQSYEITRKGLIDAAEFQKTHKQWVNLLETAGKLRSFDEAKAKEYTSIAENGKKQEKLDKQLSAARNAKRDGNWQQVYDCAEAALQIDSKCAEALTLKDEALENLEPHLQVYAELNGERVEPKINWKQDKPEGTESPFKLTKGKTYAASLSYRDAAGQEYTGEIAPFTCTENSLKEVTVPLKKVVFTGIVSLPGNIQLEMIRVEAGTFTMGKQDGENESDETEHSVTLKNAFWIGKTEVTQAQWKAVMGTDIRQQRDKANREWPLKGEGDNYPMYYISWEECKKFCEKLNELLAGKLPSGYQFDLPTEAQWEYVARGGKKSKGYKYSGSNDISEVAWYWDNADKKTHPVGVGKEPNELGLYDMSGNVYEWCRDWYEKGYASDPEFLSGNTGSHRVRRGGSWDVSARYCRSSNRYYNVSTYRNFYLGLRFALVQVQ